MKTNVAIQCEIARASDSYMLSASVDEPDICPHCLSHINPKLIATTGKIEPSNEVHLAPKCVDVIFRCNNRACLRTFICRYKDITPQQNLVFLAMIPSPAAKVEIPPEVLRVSTEFESIYRQGLEAESHGLQHAAGGALRKALEFLIKEYCMSLQTENAVKTKIETMYLKNVIEEYVQDPNIKQAALLSTWLGNDQMHFKAFYVDKDLQVFKKLLTMTMHWISNAEGLKDLVAAMPPVKAKR